MIEVKPFGREDFARLIEWATSRELVVQWSGLGFTHPLDQPQLDAYLRHAEENPNSRVVWKAVHTGDGQVVGHIELDRIHEGSRRARLSRVLVAPERRGQGIGRAMTILALRHAFDVLGLHRVDLGVYDFNEVAIRCYESCGFVREGVERDSTLVGDAYWSAV